MKELSEPRTLSERMYIFFTGLCMGAGNIVPGVSGGTMALIMGVYEDLLHGIKSFDARMVKGLLRRQWKEALTPVPWMFLILLAGGIGTAILGLARLIEDLSDHQEVLLLAFFFGLIVASILVVGRSISWNGRSFVALGLGALCGVLFVTLSPREIGHDPLTVFLCGGVAALAMILPGLSGAFLLLVLGQYAWVIEQLNERNVLALIPLGAGAVCGLLLFARFLSWLLNRYHGETLALLVGFMMASLRRIWPWREATETVVIRGEKRILADRMVWPELNGELAMAVSLALVGVVLILVLEGVQRQRGAGA